MKSRGGWSLARKCQRCSEAVVDGVHVDVYGKQTCLRVLDVEIGGNIGATTTAAIVQDATVERFERAMAGRWYLRTKRLARVNDMFEEAEAGRGGGLEQLDAHVCAECMKEVFREYDERLRDHKRFIDAYSTRLEDDIHSLPQADTPSSLWEAEALQEQEAKLDAELEACQHELRALQEQEDQLEKEEAAFLEARHREDQRALSALGARYFENQEICGLVASVRSLSERLAAAQAARVHEDLFLIRQEDHFAMINGLRVGSLPGTPVSWEEINAALGECCLLLFVCSSKLNFNFRTFRPIPQGENSFMQRVSNLELMPLSGSLRSTVFSSAFNSALGALLTATDELAQGVFKVYGSKPRYRVTGDMIGDDKDQWYSIKRPIGDSPKWVRALLYLVANLKMVLGLCAAVGKKG